jgi:hypothetical protein
MTAALKQHWLPALEADGFTGRFPRYQRLRGDAAIDFVMVAYDKPATALFLEFGSRPRGALRTSWGEFVPEERLLLEHVPFTRRARLQARCDGGSTSDQWFAFGGFGDDAASYDALALRLRECWSQVTAWLEGGAVGANVSPNDAGSGR